ncbi:MAG TPA: hypothetical protein VHX11_08250 [Acidobacteriaceae bacterium]|jgi:hypothetical protein|nr:hypothetical protein [Acidobacteriaceae bacterium]
MNDLDKALGDIGSIRRQVARSTEFRGYGPATLATTGVFALSAAGAQSLWVSDPAHHIARYLGIWAATAFLSAVFTGVQMYMRSRRIHSGMSDEMIHMAVEQFLPSLVAGLLLTLVLVYASPGAVWILPGIWQIVFGLGIFSSSRFLPRPILLAGVWYLLSGLVCMGFGDARALSPWAMGVPFGVGQFLVAAILLAAAQRSSDET